MTLVRLLALLGALAVAGALGCTEEPCRPLPFEAHSVDVSSPNKYYIQAVTVTAGPCTSMYDCSEDSPTGDLSTFCGTHTGGLDEACTFVVRFGVPGASYQCRIAARPAQSCGVHQALDVTVTASRSGGSPRCYDSNNDPQLFDASTAAPLDAGAG